MIREKKNEYERIQFELIKVKKPFMRKEKWNLCHVNDFMHISLSYRQIDVLRVRIKKNENIMTIQEKKGFLVSRL